MRSKCNSEGKLLGSMQAAVAESTKESSVSSWYGKIHRGASAILQGSSMSPAASATGDANALKRAATQMKNSPRNESQEQFPPDSRLTKFCLSRCHWRLWGTGNTGKALNAHYNEKQVQPHRTITKIYTKSICFGTHRFVTQHKLHRKMKEDTTRQNYKSNSVVSSLDAMRVAQHIKYPSLS